LENPTLRDQLRLPIIVKREKAWSGRYTRGQKTLFGKEQIKIITLSRTLTAGNNRREVPQKRSNSRGKSKPKLEQTLRNDEDED